MTKSNLKLVAPQPTLDELLAAETSAEQTVRDAETAFAQRDTPSALATPKPNDRTTIAWNEAFYALEQARRGLGAARVAVADHRRAGLHAAGESDRRASLSAAIAAASKAAAAVETARARAVRAADFRDHAEQAHAAAVAAVAAAREESARLAEDAVISGASPAGAGTLRKARERETEAADALDAASAASAKIEATIPDLEREARQAAGVVTAAIDFLLTMPIGRLVDEAARLQEELGARRAVLHHLRGAADDHDRSRIAEYLKHEFLPFGPNDTPRDHPAMEPWRAARAALTRNANAPLPAVDG